MRITQSFICLFAATAVTATLSAQQLRPISSGLVAVEIRPVATGLSGALEFVSAKDNSGRLFIVEQGGRIKILKNGAINSKPFLDISSQIRSGGETGLLGLAFHPGFSNAASPGFRKFYTYENVTPSGTADFTVPTSSGFDNQCVVTEWQISGNNPDVADLASRRDLLRVDHPQSNHNGGKIAFRPSDGFLYIGIGDGGNGNDVGDGHNPTIGNGQDISRVLGKILRIDPVAPALKAGSANPVSANGKYRIPRDNPFVGSSGLDEIYAYGFRNPFRFSFDAVADRLIVGDVGQGSVEEVDIVTPGKNYGWNRKEGSFLFNPSNGSISPDPNPNPAYTDPVLEYGHSEGISVIGGFVYRGSAIPALAGKYVFGDFRGPETGSGRLFYSDLTSGIIQELRLGLNPRPLGPVIKSFGEDSAGELYVVADFGGSTEGKVFKIVPIPAAAELVNLSTRAHVETGDNVVIAGFILTGSAPKNIVLRGLGPSLKVNGQAVADRLTNPTLTLSDERGRQLRANDDWGTSPQKQQLIDLRLAPSDARESAALIPLQPGAYTVALSGVDGEKGIGLAELYDVQQGAPANAVNISTRARVGTGDNVMIGGFIVGGSQSQRLLLRAIGPSLGANGVTGVLQNPTLEIVNASGTTIGSNDNWQTDQATEIRATGLPPENDAEAAIIRTVSPGNYTAIVRGAAESTGVGLVEVYRLNP